MGIYLVVKMCVGYAACGAIVQLSSVEKDLLVEWPEQDHVASTKQKAAPPQSLSVGTSLLTLGSGGWS